MIRALFVVALLTLAGCGVDGEPQPPAAAAPRVAAAGAATGAAADGGAPSGVAGAN